MVDEKFVARRVSHVASAAGQKRGEMEKREGNSLSLCTHPRQRYRRKAVPRELHLLARLTAALTREDPRRCKGAHPHAVADEEDDAARHPGRRRGAADAGTRCRRLDPRLDRPRRRFIPDLPLCEQTGLDISRVRAT